MLGHYFFGIAIFVTSVFLVLLVLVQRGRGGGLVGALGGPGGQSALGTKAGDVFTRITIVVAAIWIFLCAAAVRTLNPSNTDAPAGLTKVTATMGDDSAAGAGAGAGDARKSDAPGAATAPAVGTDPATTPAATPPTTPRPRLLLQQRPRQLHQLLRQKPSQLKHQRLLRRHLQLRRNQLSLLRQRKPSQPNLKKRLKKNLLSLRPKARSQLNQPLHLNHLSSSWCESGWSFL